MRAPETKTIDGTKYEVRPLPTGDGLRMMATIAKIVGPALGKATTLEETMGAVGDVIGDFVDRLEPAELEPMCLELAKQTFVEAQPGSGNMVLLKDVFGTHFSGDYLALFAWFRFALEVNFGPLVSALASRVAVGGRARGPA